MIKIFCDDCEKEILDENYVEQTVMIHYSMEDSADTTICRDCWEKTLDRVKTLEK